MKYKDEDLKRVQETELDIFCDIIRACEENQITYSIYGTALGLVRHHGSFPGMILT